MEKDPAARTPVLSGAKLTKPVVRPIAANLIWPYRRLQRRRSPRRVSISSATPKPLSTVLHFRLARASTISLSMPPLDLVTRHVFLRHSRLLHCHLGARCPR